MVFGADGNLYVASGNWFNGINGPFYTGDFPAGAVLRYQGPTGANPGAFLGTFVAGGGGSVTSTVKLPDSRTTVPAIGMLRTSLGWGPLRLFPR